MRLIDADNIEHKKFVTTDNAYELGWNDAIDEIIANEPTADSVPKEKHDRLLANAMILVDAVEEYERREECQH